MVSLIFEEIGGYRIQNRGLPPEISLVCAFQITLTAKVGTVFRVYGFLITTLVDYKVLIKLIIARFQFY